MGELHIGVSKMRVIVKRKGGHIAQEMLDSWVKWRSTVLEEEELFAYNNEIQVE